MADDAINEATLELLERRIADRVTEQARKRVIGHYAVVGATLVGVSGLIGWSVVSWVEREARSEIQSQIQKMTQQVQQASQKVGDLQRDIDTKLQVLDALRGRAGQTLDNVEATLTRFEPKSHKLEQVIVDIDELENRVRPIRGASDLADQNRADLERLGGQLSELAQQVTQLAGAVQSTPLGAEGPTGAYKGVASATEKVAAGSSSLANEIAVRRAAPTVYVQFSGFTREQVDQLRSTLAAGGFTVPAAERTGSASSLFEIRYFYDEDREAADRLTLLVTDAAQRLLKETRTAKTTNVTGYPGTKPKPATLELWYGPRAG